MQKLLFRGILLTLVFFLSLGFFITMMKEHSLTREVELTEMSEVTLPVVSALVEEEEINFMYGHVKDPFSLGVREEITPIKEGGTLSFMLYHHGNEITAVEYEMNNRADRIVMETGEGMLNSLDENGEKSKITIKTSYGFSQETEYGLKLILINQDGKKIYYYTTLKYRKEDKFRDRFRFIRKLEKSIFAKKDEKEIKPYLESDSSMDNKSFAHVNIHSSYDLVTWGNLKPKKVTTPKISVIENNAATTGVLFRYVASVGEEHKNYYFVSEYYRVHYNERTFYLLAYDRKTEEIFAPEKTSVSKKQFKFGIGDEKSEVLFTEDEKYLCFVRERELWQYQAETNLLSKVFSFRKEGFEEDRELLHHHKVKPLRLEDNGDVFFAVYGYMNRGVYEGRTGLVLYQYHHGEQRIEELVSIPTDRLYKELIHEMDRVSYLNAEGFFYFTLDGSLYAYSLVKRKVELVAKKVKKDLFLSLNKGRRIAWQEEEGKEEICILDLETRKVTLIKREEGKKLTLFSSLNDNLIYGIADEKDIQKQRDGSLLVPNESIFIANSGGEILKKYERKNEYVIGVFIDQTVIHLKRLKKKKNIFEETTDDQILNNEAIKTEDISIVDRKTEKYLTEYYLRMPKNTEIKDIPRVFDKVKNTVILSETTGKIPENDVPNIRYYANIYGEIFASSKNPAEMIRLADQGMGYVTDSTGALIWERGRMRPQNRAEEVDIDYSEKKDTEKEAAIRLFLTASGIYISDSELKTGESILTILNSQKEIRALDLTGISLEEVLYYVSEGRPVIAMEEEHLVLLVGYQPKSVMLMNVRTGEIKLLPKEEAEKRFQKSGNRFIGAVE